MTQETIDSAHIIADLQIELGKARRATRATRALLIDAAHAHTAGRNEVTAEYIDRSINNLQGI